jgi:small toxic polypeptide LdrA/B/C/D
MTYAWLSLAFLAAAAVVGVVAVAAAPRRSILPLVAGAMVLCAVVLGVLTAVFDNVMIAVGLMQYSARHIAGLHVGAAPLEDFAYPLAAVILLPSLWAIFAKRTGVRR